MNNNILTGPLNKVHEKPKKLVFLLHGYGDNAENFIHISTHLDSLDFKANYIALNAPSSIPDYPSGKRWFPLSPHTIKFTNKEDNNSALIKQEILNSLNLLKNSITKIKDIYNLKFKDCFLVGFSQGGMISFEFANYLEDSLAGLAIISSRIIRNDLIENSFLLKTPIFISHGDQDQVLPIQNFFRSCKFLTDNKLFFEDHIIKGDEHTISPMVINKLKEFIKKHI